MQVEHFSYEGLNHILDRILDGVTSYLKSNNELEGSADLTISADDEALTWNRLRYIKNAVETAPSNRPAQENIILDVTSQLNDLDSEGFFGYGWRDEFGLEIFR